MSKVLILSEKALLSKKEEKSLAEEDIRVMISSRYGEDLMKNGIGNADVIVIDDSLRGVELFKACGEIRAASGALIILLGSMPSWEMWEKGEEIGFNRYYRKPITPHDLEIKIKLAMREINFRESTALPQNDNAEEVEAVVQGKPAKAEIMPVKNAEIKLERAEQKPVVTGKFPETMVKTAEKPETKAKAEEKPAAAPVLNPEPASGPDDASEIWQDPKAAGLLSGLINGKIKQIIPEIDLRLTEGFGYRVADAVMGTKGKATIQVLETLAGDGLLIKQAFDKILQSPGGSFQLIPVERCPQCDSSQIGRGQLIEHFSCGYIGLEEEFQKGLNQICPKCKHELKLIGTDYRKPGVRYICNGCHGIFPAPAIKCRCLANGEVYSLEELREVPLYTYNLNEARKQRLEFELEPKRQLVGCLVGLGYEVKEGVPVQGKSGATHTIDILAVKDDLLIKHTVAIGVLAAPLTQPEVTIDALFGFDSKVYDAGIEKKVVIAVPTIAPDAMKFAERQGIRVYTLEELRSTLFCNAPQSEVISVTREQKAAETTDPAELSKLGPREWLKRVLEKRGYKVSEKLKVMGRSGAEHVLDMYAEKDDGIINHKLAACVVINEDRSNHDVNDVIQFDTAAYDAHIRDKIVISVPGLSKEAQQFAEYQRIKVLEAKELSGFSGRSPDTEEAARQLSALLRA